MVGLPAEAVVTAVAGAAGWRGPGGKVAGATGDASGGLQERGGGVAAVGAAGGAAGQRGVAAAAASGREKLLGWGWNDAGR